MFVDRQHSAAARLSEAILQRLACWNDVGHLLFPHSSGLHAREGEPADGASLSALWKARFFFPTFSPDCPARTAHNSSLLRETPRALRRRWARCAPAHSTSPRRPAASTSAQSRPQRTRLRSHIVDIAAAAGGLVCPGIKGSDAAPLAPDAGATSTCTISSSPSTSRRRRLYRREQR